VTVQRISAITLAVHDMARSVQFYQHHLGLRLLYGGNNASFTSLAVGAGYLNLILASDRDWSWWGRAIFYVDDVDEVYRRLVDAGLSPSTTPEDAPWGERYFHINDPDGHKLSLARPIGPRR
jgi:catechol 2,3-dioxygenase-like lactoylglutathione lyase family enzyme